MLNKQDFEPVEPIYLLNQFGVQNVQTNIKKAHIAAGSMLEG